MADKENIVAAFSRFVPAVKPQVIMTWDMYNIEQHQLLALGNSAHPFQSCERPHSSSGMSLSNTAQT